MICCILVISPPFDAMTQTTSCSFIFVLACVSQEGTLTKLIQDQAEDNLTPAATRGGARPAATAPPSLYTNIDALSWSLDVARALEYLHGCRPPVVHRDVKPENILMTRSASALAPASSRGLQPEGGDRGKAGGGGGRPWTPALGLVAKLADFGLHAVSDMVTLIHHLFLLDQSHEPIHLVRLHIMSPQLCYHKPCTSSSSPGRTGCTDIMPFMRIPSSAMTTASHFLLLTEQYRLYRYIAIHACSKLCYGYSLVLPSSYKAVLYRTFCQPE